MGIRTIETQGPPGADARITCSSCPPAAHEINRSVMLDAHVRDFDRSGSTGRMLIRALGTLVSNAMRPARHKRHRRAEWPPWRPLHARRLGRVGPAIAMDRQ